MKNNNFIRSSLRFVSVFLLAFFFLGFAKIPVMAESAAQGDNEGKWVLVKKDLPELGESEDRVITFDNVSVSREGCLCFERYKVNKPYELQFDYTVPPDILRVGDIFEGTVALSGTYDSEGVQIHVAVKHGDEPHHFIETPINGGEKKFSSRIIKERFLDTYAKPGENRFQYMEIKFYVGALSPQTIYYYEWQGPDSIIPLLTEDSEGGGEGEGGEEGEDAGRLDISIDSRAKGIGGETENSIPLAVVVGVLGAVAATGAAGMAGAGANSGGHKGFEEKASDGQEQGYFQMIIGKDFGDALKWGKRQRVWIRMVEIRDGISIERPDLLPQISILSDEIMVGALTQQGPNLEAQVQITENSPPEGTISFIYSGEYGSFRNNVRFRLLDKGKIILVADKVSILSNDSKAFELVYQLKDFVQEEPPIEITASSGLVALDIGENDKGESVILVSPGPDAQAWDQKNFIKTCKCTVTALDDQIPIKASFEVNVCFEGIGTAYERLKINEVPEDADIECFTDKEKEKREKKALWLPLTVMKWNEKDRKLKADSASSASLQFTFAVHPEAEFQRPESKTAAQQLLNRAGLEARAMSAPPGIEIKKTFQPSVYRLMAINDPSPGTPSFDIQITVSSDKDTSLPPLILKARMRPNIDFKAMVQWFLENPMNAAPGEFIKLGDVSIYHRALDFIENRVYPWDSVPWSASWMPNRSDSSHYEPGRGDIMRKSFIAIRENEFPECIDPDQFSKVRVLVHELCHVIEDMHDDYLVDDKSERHAYYLQHLADVSWQLKHLENPGSNINIDVIAAINGAYCHYTDPFIVGDLSNIGPWFGAEFSISVHELFDKYAYHIDTLGGRMPEMTADHREKVAKAVRHWYFPGNLSNVEVQRGIPADAKGSFVETDGLFAGARWTFNWNQASLRSVELSHGDYSFDIKDYYWEGGNKIGLRLLIDVKSKKDPFSDFDSMEVFLDAGTYDISGRYFPTVDRFYTKWASLIDEYRSLIYKNTKMGGTRFRFFTSNAKRGN